MGEMEGVSKAYNYNSTTRVGVSNRIDAQVLFWSSLERHPGVGHALNVSMLGRLRRVKVGRMGKMVSHTHGDYELHAKAIQGDLCGLNQLRAVEV